MKKHSLFLMDMTAMILLTGCAKKAEPEESSTLETGCAQKFVDNPLMSGYTTIGIERSRRGSVW